MNNRKYLILLTITSTLCLAARFADGPMEWQVDYATKPLLMPFLYLFYRQMTRPELSLKQSLIEFFTMGLFFAWMGDYYAHPNYLIMFFGCVRHHINYIS